LSGVEDRSESTVFMYLHAVINGLQGLFLFYIYCPLAKDVRKKIAKVTNVRSLHSSWHACNSRILKSHH